jgi:APA family basic amino acid/polyamine antiporter
MHKIVLKFGEQKEPSLRRELNLFQAVMYGVGLILGAGIYVLIGDVAAMAGDAMWLSFVIAAFIAVFTGLSYAELSSIFPKSAAEYVFVKNAFRNNLVAFSAGWLITFVAITSAAAVAIGFAGYIAYFLPGFDLAVPAIVLVIGLSGINFIGIKESIWMNTTFTIIEIVGLAIVVSAAFVLGSFIGADFTEMPPAVSSSLSLSTGAIIAAAGLAFFAYFGFENLANIAEETKNATKTTPRALLISIAVTTGIYIIIAISAIALVGWKDLSSTDAPLALATEKAFGRMGSAVLSAIALFATSNTVLMMLVAGSRIMFGMSKESSLPVALGRVHQSRNTPAVAVFVTMILTVAVIATSGGSISSVANAAVFAIFVVYALVNLSLIWLRYKQPEISRPFRSPLRIGRFPLLAGIGLATSLAMLTQFDYVTMTIGGLAVGTGIACYPLLKRNRGNLKI